MARIPPSATPWGLPSSPIFILTYTPPSASQGIISGSVPGKPSTVAFLARHGLHHQYAPHEIPTRANVAALKRLGVRTVIGFSAVGSLREEVRPRDFCVAGGVVDWTKGVRPWTFFEDGVVGHISMADPFDDALSAAVARAIAAPGVLEGESKGQGKEASTAAADAEEKTSSSAPKVHPGATVICIEGPQFSTRQESLLYRSFQTNPPISCINMSAVPECKLFREAEMSYALVCMSTDYDSWHASNEGVSVAMVMQHMKWNGVNAKRAVEAILSELGKEGVEEEVGGRKLKGASRGGAMGLGSHVEGDGGRGEKAVERLKWLFGEEWIAG